MKISKILRGAGVAAALVLFSIGFGAPVLADELEDAVAAADATAGAQQFRQCMACHTSEEGAANRVGPNLYGVVGRQIGSVDGYRYSRALAGSEEFWTLENLNAFLENPRAARPGNAMSFAGLRNEAQRMNMLAFLASLGGHVDQDDDDDDHDGHGEHHEGGE